jgi:hypothetical protein
MDAFFSELGRTVLARWKAVDFSLPAFPAIAQAALEENPPAEQVDLAAFIREFLIEDEQPFQTASGFGQPEIVAYDHPRFYIQLLFWMDGTTDIHQHEFSGAFHVMAGSSLHSEFEFDNAESVTAHFRVGDLRLKGTELLETGATVPITSGRGCIHALFHLDTPSVTVVVRTHSDPGTGPQFTYLPPHVAVDPVHHDALTMRRKQLLDVLERVGDPDYAELALAMVEELDFERGFFILQNGIGALRSLGAWEDVLGAFETKHGARARGVAATLEEILRRDGIVALRAAVEDPEHRFFLALLLNLTNRADILDLVAQRFPGDAIETILRWAAELADASDGAWLVDAEFPEEIAVDEEEQADVFLTALQGYLTGAETTGDLAAEDAAALREALARSSWRVLAAG